MRRLLLAILILVVLGGLFIAFDGPARLGIETGFGPSAADDGEDDPNTDAGAALPVVRAVNEVLADAVVVPAQFAALSMSAGGIVDELMVAEGDVVDAGELLLTLENRRQVAAVEQARAALFRARAQLEEQRAGARAEELTAAEAAVDAAKAQLSGITEAARSSEVVAAEAELTSAQAAYSALFSGPDEEDQIARQAELLDAEARLTQSQRAYNLIAWRNDVGASPEAAALQEATNGVEAARARYNQLFAAPDADQIAAAQARIEQAQAELERILTPGTSSQIAEAEANLRRAQADYDLLLAGPRDEAIAQAAAAVAEAEAQLSLAEADLADTELYAPFAGTLAMLETKVGEQIGAGTVVVQLADLTAWRVETSDLTEIGIVDIEVGDTATITFDAIDDLEIEGTIVRIRPIGENKQGDITYTVIIEPVEQDGRLRWNMTAVVRIGEE